MMLPNDKTEVLEEPRMTEPNQSGFLDLLIKLSAWRLFILKFVAVAAALSFAISLILPKSYTSTVKIMPPQQGQSVAASMLAQLGPLATLAGRDLGVRNPADVYLYMLHSYTVSDDLIEHFSLMNVYGVKTHTEAREELEKRSEITSGREGGIVILVTDHDPRRAAEIANAYVDELRKLTQTLAVTEASKRRLFFEREVQKANNELAQAELDMKNIQERTGIFHLDSQAKAMIEMVATLHARVASKEEQVEAMRSYATPENPDLRREQGELSALRAELGRMEGGQDGSLYPEISMHKVPAAGLEYVRGLRDVKYRETLLELLSRQYEIARIDEARDATVIQVLDNAVPPERRSAPQRAFIVAMAVVLALFFAMGFALIVERIKEDRSLEARLLLLKDRLVRGR